jgi:hypothetical protein
MPKIAEEVGFQTELFGIRKLLAQSHEYGILIDCIQIRNL